MARKKLSEMTPYERVDSRMKGMTWEEAEEVGVEILSRVLALHAFSRKEEKYFLTLSERIINRCLEYAKSDEGRTYLTFAAVGFKREQMEKENKQ